MNRNQQLATLYPLINRRAQLWDTVGNLKKKLFSSEKELEAVDSAINHIIVAIYPSALPTLPQEHEGRAFRNENDELHPALTLNTPPAEGTGSFVAATPTVTPTATDPAAISPPVICTPTSDPEDAAPYFESQYIPANYKGMSAAKGVISAVKELEQKKMYEAMKSYFDKTPVLVYDYPPQNKPGIYQTIPEELVEPSSKMVSGTASAGTAADIYAAGEGK